jgi:GINS complex subunit 4
LDDAAGGISMVEQPDLDKAVFTRILKDSDESIEVEGTDIAFKPEKGSILVIRWSAIKEIVERGEAELL